jgi:hypothetical protein
MDDTVFTASNLENAGYDENCCSQSRLAVEIHAAVFILCIADV